MNNLLRCDHCRKTIAQQESATAGVVDVLVREEIVLRFDVKRGKLVATFCSPDCAVSA